MNRSIKIMLGFCLCVNQQGIAGTVKEYFGMGHYEVGARMWYARMYDGTVEACFDDEGNLIGANRYSAFGSRISDVGESENREAYQGQDYREKVNHYNLGVRNMRPDSGQWLQPEPVVVDGFSQGKLLEPLACSPYRYARNTPTCFTDKTGWEPVPACSDLSEPLEPGTQIMNEEGVVTVVPKQDVMRYSYGAALLTAGVFVPKYMTFSETLYRDEVPVFRAGYKWTFTLTPHGDVTGRQEKSLVLRNPRNCNFTEIDNLSPSVTDARFQLSFLGQHTYLFSSSRADMQELLSSHIGGYGGQPQQGGAFPQFFCHILQDAGSEGQLPDGAYTLRFRDQDAWFWQDDMEQHECVINSQQVP